MYISVCWQLAFLGSPTFAAPLRWRLSLPYNWTSFYPQIPAVFALGKYFPSSEQVIKILNLLWPWILICLNNTRLGGWLTGGQGMWVKDDLDAKELEGLSSGGEGRQEAHHPQGGPTHPLPRISSGIANPPDLLWNFYNHRPSSVADSEGGVGWL